MLWTPNRLHQSGSWWVSELEQCARVLPPGGAPVDRSLAARNQCDTQVLLSGFPDFQQRDGKWRLSDSDFHTHTWGRDRADKSYLSLCFYGHFGKLHFQNSWKRKRNRACQNVSNMLPFPPSHVPSSAHPFPIPTPPPAGIRIPNQPRLHPTPTSMNPLRCTMPTTLEVDSDIGSGSAEEDSRSSLPYPIESFTST